LRRPRWPIPVLLITYTATASLMFGQGGAKQPPANPPAAAGAAVPSDWASSTRQAISRSEYQASRQAQTLLPGAGALLQAPNRAQGLRTYFTPSGIRVVPRTGGGPAWTWGTDLIAYGSAGSLVAAGQVEPAVAGNRVTYERDGMTEWYVNTPAGLEQGFTFEQPPPGVDGGTLEVRLGLWGSVRPSRAQGAIDFRQPAGDPVLRYTQLTAIDAAGRHLRSDMSLTGTAGIRITVRTEGASYPVTIDPLALDPLALSADWTAESNQASSWYGYSVNTAGDVNGDGYDDVIVGAYRYDDGQDNEGAAFVYYGSADGPSLTPDWSAESDLVGSWYGHSVSGAGDVNGDGFDDVIVGAPNPDHGTTIGLAYAYYGSATGLSPVANWTAQGDQLVDWFGRRVQRAGDVNGDGFADVIVGVPHYDSDRVDVGKAVAYYGSPAGLSPTANWTAIGAQVLCLFGRDAKGAGDVNGDGYDDVIVGAHQYDHGEKNEGRAFVYAGSPTGLRTKPLWKQESNQPGAVYGRSVNTAGDVNGDGYADIIVGAPQYDDGQTNEGEAFLYFGSPTGPGLTANWTAQADQADAWFGRAVAGAGNLNADGYNDVIIGAPNYDTGKPDGGKAFVYLGSPAGPSLSPNWTTGMSQDHAWFARSVASAGDVNADGYDDVITGAPQFDDPDKDEGGAFVFFGPLGIS
jgi:FG-GAP repeat protein